MGSRPAPHREQTLSDLCHPQELRLGRPRGSSWVRPISLLRVDHPAADRLRHGDPTLGWDGDPRLCLYADPANDHWVLIRWEFDGVPRAVCTNARSRLNDELVTQLIKRLIEHDSRRGFDAFDAVRETNDRVTTAADKAFEDRVENDLADRLRWGLKRDKADQYA